MSDVKDMKESAPLHLVPNSKETVVTVQKHDILDVHQNTDIGVSIKSKVNSSAINNAPFPFSFLY